MKHSGCRHVLVSCHVLKQESGYVFVRKWVISVTHWERRVTPAAEVGNALGQRLSLRLFCAATHSTKDGHMRDTLSWQYNNFSGNK